MFISFTGKESREAPHIFLLEVNLLSWIDWKRNPVLSAKFWFLRSHPMQIVCLFFFVPYISFFLLFQI